MVSVKLCENNVLHNRNKPGNQCAVLGSIISDRHALLAYECHILSYINLVVDNCMLISNQQSIPTHRPGIGVIYFLDIVVSNLT